MLTLLEEGGSCCWDASALDTSRAEALHDRERNSMGSRGVSDGGGGGRAWNGSGLRAGRSFSIFRVRIG